jgi:hypothetical protein
MRHAQNLQGWFAQEEILDGLREVEIVLDHDDGYPGAGSHICIHGSQLVFSQNSSQERRTGWNGQSVRNYKVKNSGNAAWGFRRKNPD